MEAKDDKLVMLNNATAMSVLFARVEMLVKNSDLDSKEIEETAEYYRKRHLAKGMMIAEGLSFAMNDLLDRVEKKAIEKPGKFLKMTNKEDQVENWRDLLMEVCVRSIVNKLRKGEELTKEQASMYNFIVNNEPKSEPKKDSHDPWVHFHGL